MFDAKTAQKLTNRCGHLCLKIAWVFFFFCLQQASIAQGSPEKRGRLVTVTDAIRMTRLGIEDEGLDAHFYGFPDSSGGFSKGLSRRTPRAAKSFRFRVARTSP